MFTSSKQLTHVSLQQQYLQMILINWSWETFSAITLSGKYSYQCLVLWGNYLAKLFRTFKIRFKKKCTFEIKQHVNWFGNTTNRVNLPSLLIIFLTLKAFAKLVTATDRLNLAASFIIAFSTYKLKLIDTLSDLKIPLI